VEASLTHCCQKPNKHLANARDKNTWRRYTTARHVNDLAGRSTALAPPCLLLCFFGNTVNRKLKNATISDRFICYILTVQQSAALAVSVFFCGRRLKSCQFFEEKSAPKKKSWLRPWLRVTWLEDFLTSKWPGCFTMLAPHCKNRHTWKKKKKTG